MASDSALYTFTIGTIDWNYHPSLTTKSECGSLGTAVDYTFPLYKFIDTVTTTEGKMWWKQDFNPQYSLTCAHGNPDSKTCYPCALKEKSLGELIEEKCAIGSEETFQGNIQDTLKILLRRGWKIFCYSSKRVEQFLGSLKEDGATTQVIETQEGVVLVCDKKD